MIRFRGDWQADDLLLRFGDFYDLIYRHVFKTLRCVRGGPIDLMTRNRLGRFQAEVLPKRISAQ